MGKVDNQIITELMLCMIGKELEEDFTNVHSKEYVLRKALLYLIYLTQERASPAGQEFIQYLLTNFPALKEYDDQFLYPFLFDKSIKVASLENEEKQVVSRQFDIVV